MKRCPQCYQAYYDDAVIFCLDDGFALSNESEGEPVTAVFRDRAAVGVIHGARQTVAGARNTIAVLPFLNLSKDENGDYFSDGLAEELLNVLSKIRGLRVAARTSSFSFKGRPVTISEIGRALNVASVLEGSIRIVGNRVRIAVQLSTVSDGYQVWSQTYDRTMDDIFAVQDDIAESVVEELRVRLFNEKVGPHTGTEIESEVKEAVRSRAGNPEAQRLMLLGRHFLDRTTHEDTKKGY
jgi:adenylate cyclase